VEGLLALLALFFLFGPLLLIANLYSRIGTLRRRLEESDRSVHSLLSRMALLEKGASVDAEPRRVPDVAVAPEPAIDVVTEVVDEETLPPIVETQVDVVSEPAQTADSAESRGPSPAAGPEPIREPLRRTSAEWEQLVGGRLLNRIGALALIIGVGFFLKYAFDRQWITETMRVLLGGGLGVLLLGIGERSHRKGYDIFGQGLVGAGISILYLSVYASFNFYHLVPQIAAFVLMSTVTATAIVMALRRESLAIALLGWAGGFLTPILLSTGSANEVGLFSYLLLLDVFLVAVVWRRPAWSVIEILSGVATWLMYASWFAAYFRPAKLENALIFAGLFWALFHALDILRIVRRSAEQQPQHLIMSIVNGGAAYVAMTAALSASASRFDAAMADTAVMIGSLVMGGLYLASVVALERLAVDREARDRYYTTALVAIAIGLFIGLTSYAQVLAWIAVAVAAMAFAKRRDLPVLQGTATALLVAAGVALIGVPGAAGAEYPAQYHGLVSLRTLAWLSLAGGFGFAAWLRRVQDDIFTSALDVAWCFTLVAFVSVEIDDWVSHSRSMQALRTSASFPRLDAMFVALGWCALGIVITLVRKWIGRRVPTLVAQGFIAFGAVWIAVVGVETYDADVATLFNLRALGLVALLAVLFADRSILDRVTIEADTLRSIRTAIGIATILVVLELVSVEIRDHFERRLATRTLPSGARGALVNAQQLTLSGAWLVYSLALIVLGIWRRNRTVRIVALGLFAITILKIFLYDLSFLDTLYRIFSFMGLGVILLVVSWLFQRYRDLILGSDAPTPGPFPIALRAGEGEKGEW
jgi:uncharacterized membrane protein